MNAREVASHVLRESMCKQSSLTWYSGLVKSDKECVDEIVHSMSEHPGHWQLAPVCKELKAVLKLNVSQRTIERTLKDMIENAQKESA